MTRSDKLAELVANGATVAEAGRALGLNKGQTAGLWQRIKEKLGVQAV